MKNNTKIRIPKSCISIVEEIKKTEDGYWIYFEKGYDSQDKMKLHQERVRTQKEVLKSIKNAVRCNCEYCKN